MRNVLVHGIGNRAHADLVAAVADADRRNGARLSFLNDVIDPCASLSEILPEHVVIGAARRHAGTFDRDDCFRREFVDHARCISTRLCIVDRKALHDGDAAEALVTRGALRLLERHDGETSSSQRRADRLQERRIADDHGNRIEAVAQGAGKRRHAHGPVGLADLGRHPRAGQ